MYHCFHLVNDLRTQFHFRTQNGLLYSVFLLLCIFVFSLIWGGGGGSNSIIRVNLMLILHAIIEQIYELLPPPPQEKPKKHMDSSLKNFPTVKIARPPLGLRLSHGVLLSLWL